MLFRSVISSRTTDSDDLKQCSRRVCAQHFQELKAKPWWRPGCSRGSGKETPFQELRMQKHHWSFLKEDWVFWSSLTLDQRERKCYYLKSREWTCPTPCKPELTRCQHSFTNPKNFIILIFRWELEWDFFFPICPLLPESNTKKVTLATDFFLIFFFFLSFQHMCCFVVWFFFCISHFHEFWSLI